MTTYLFKSPILIKEEEYEYDSGVLHEYFLHQFQNRKARNVEKALQKEIIENENENELAQYIHENSPLKGIVTSIIIGVENGMAVATVEATRELTTDEIEEVKDEVRSQYSDGWGEDFERVDDSYEKITVYDDETGEEFETRSTVYSNVYFYNDEQFEFVVQKEEEKDEPVSFNIPTPKPRLKLVGEDGNIFSIMGRARSVLKEHGMKEEADEISKKITSSKSYNEALGVVMNYFQVY